VASIVHALTVLIAVIVLAPLIGYLPMAGLAALLLLVAWNMSEVKHFAHILRVAPRSDALVLVTCFVLTVVFDMVVAVSVGVVLAALLFMRRMAEITHTRLTGEGSRGAGPTGIPPGLEKKIAIYDVAGPLFFGAAQKAVGSLAAIDDRLKALIVRLDQVPIMDATGLVALESAIAGLSNRGCLTILSGLQKQPRGLLERAGLEKRGWKLLIRPDTQTAIDAATSLVQPGPDPLAT
jgi:SulP family sulfate permease